MLRATEPGPAPTSRCSRKLPRQQESRSSRREVSPQSKIFERSRRCSLSKSLERSRAEPSTREGSRCARPHAQSSQADWQCSRGDCPLALTSSQLPKNLLIIYTEPLLSGLSSARLKGT